jgi:hypothetical protein
MKPIFSLPFGTEKIQEKTGLLSLSFYQSISYKNYVNIIIDILEVGSFLSNP